MDNYSFPMSEKPVFKIHNTKRSNEKGAEYILIFQYNFPTTFMKYFDVKMINYVEINLNDKKQIGIFVKDTYTQDQVLESISMCCENFIDSHFLSMDEIVGPVFIEKVYDQPEEPMHVEGTRSADDIEEDIVVFKDKLKEAVAKEDYMSAAEFRDKLLKLDGEKASR